MNNLILNELQKPITMSNDKDGINVKIGIYSGLPNPEMLLTDNLASQLTEMLRSALGKVRAHPPAQPGLGEFYGFLIELPEDILRELILTGPVTVFSGVVSGLQKNKSTYWQDSSGIEAFLIRIAYKNGFGDLLKRLNVSEPD